MTASGWNPAHNWKRFRVLDRRFSKAGALLQQKFETPIDRLPWRRRQPHRNKPIFCHSQIAAHILSAQFLGESHQHRPVRTLAHILGSFFRCRLTAATATNKGIHVNSVLARPLPAYAGDQR